MSAVLDLILAPDFDAYVAAARPFVRDPDSLDVLVPELLRETALRTWREEYPKHVPHALFALLGGIDSRDTLGGPDRARPVIQALSYTSRERHLDPWPIEATPARGGPEELAAGLEDGDLDTAFSAVRALAAEGRIAEIRDGILSAGSRDEFNVCHRFLYAAKALQRIEREPGVDVAALLFPVVHYHATAPRENGYGPLLDEPAERSLEEVFASAVRNLSGCEEYDWVPVAHAATLAETARWWASVSDHPATGMAARLADLFLLDALAEGGATYPGRGPARDGSPEDLIAAIGRRKETRARAIARGLEADPANRHALGDALLTACARIDGSLAFSHDVKVAAGTVRFARTSDSPHLDHVLSDVAAFLARLPKGDDLAAALF
jgi:hypothetical protein